MVAKNKGKKAEQELWFLFDLRGEYHGHVGIANNGKGVLMLKKGNYNNFLLSLGRQLGDPKALRFNYIVKNVDLDATRRLFDDEGFTVQKATTQDFAELEIEMDSLLGSSTTGEQIRD